MILIFEVRDIRSSINTISQTYMECGQICKKIGLEKEGNFSFSGDKAPLNNKRVRADIEPTVAYLCNRVTRSGEVYWRKLRQLMNYLRKTVDRIRIIEESSV